MSVYASVTILFNCVDLLLIHTILALKIEKKKKKDIGHFIPKIKI